MDAEIRRQVATAVEEADLFLPVAPGTDVALFCGLLVHLADTTASGIDPNSPQFKQALYSCRSLLPPGNGFGTGH